MSSDKMRICHVISRITADGVRESTLFAIRGYLQKGHEVVLVTGLARKEREDAFPQKADSPQFEIVELPALTGRLDPRSEYRAYRELLEFFRERKFDVVHTHGPKAGVAARVAARRAGTPVVVHTVHGSEFEPGEKGWRNALYRISERFAARYCDRIFAAAHNVVDQCVEAKIAPRGKYTVVYRGIDTSPFADAKREPGLRDELGIPQNARVIATLAGLSPEKGYEFVVPAAARVIRKYPDTHMLLIGGGPMLHSLKAQTLELGVLANFHFAGSVPLSQIPRYLAQADLFWHLLPHERFLRPIIQALAAGLPAVAFRIGGIPEVVKDGETGYCVEPEQPGEVAKATAKLWNDPAAARRMGETGKFRALEQFAWPRMAATFEKEYRELLERKTRR